MSIAIPDKKYFKIGEVSKLCELEPHVLRFWETEFNTIKPKKDGGNQRLYQKKDIEAILQIKSLLYEEKFTIPGAKEKIRELTSTAEQIASDSDEGEMKRKLMALKSGLKEIRDLLS